MVLTSAKTHTKLSDFFLGFVSIESKISKEKKNLFEDIYEELEQIIEKEAKENKNNEDINNINKMVIDNLKKLGIFISKKDNNGIFIDLTTGLGGQEKCKGCTYISNIINSINEKISNKESVYVIVPHIPYIYIGKVKNLRYYGEELNNKFYDQLSNLLKYFYAGLGKNGRKKLINNKNDLINFFGQLIQSFEVEDFKKFNYVDLPLSFLMVPSRQARLYRNDSNEKKEFIQMVKDLYENGRVINKDMTKNLLLNWFTPTSIEELSATLLYYENKNNAKDLEIYHMGGAGDNGFDIIGTDDKKIKFVAQCKTSFDYKDIKLYGEKLKLYGEKPDSSIKFYYISIDKKPDDIPPTQNTEIWDKPKLLDLIGKYRDELNKIPQFEIILNKYRDIK